MEFKMDNIRKKDLRSGYVVETRGGTLYMIARVEQDRFMRIFVTHDRWFGENDLDENLKYPRFSHLDIMKVYGLADLYTNSIEVSTDNRPLLWERKEAKRVTIDEIRKKFGISGDIEIIVEDK